MSNSVICCTSEQLRIDSPEPPARPLAAIDGIFAATCLPEDHPHALRFPERKPETDPAIVQSPSITSKIKLQFQRKSVKNLKKTKEYDEDARQMTLQEVLDEMGSRSSPNDSDHESVQQQRFGSVLELDKPRLPSPRTVSPDIRNSVLHSLGYLQPMLQRSSSPRLSYAPHNTVNLTTHTTSQGVIVKVLDSDNRTAPKLVRSLSSPILRRDGNLSHAQPMRSRSENELMTSSPLSDHGSHSLFTEQKASKRLGTPLTLKDTTSHSENVPTFSSHLREPTKTDASESMVPFPDYEEPEPSISEDAPHLQNMDISQQLRCMSQMSGTTEGEGRLHPSQTPSAHNRSRSELLLSSGRGRHVRQQSSSGIDSASVPSRWGRVCSPVHDAASSIYSRPVSPISSASEHDRQNDEAPQEAKMSNLDAVFADWPLKTAESMEAPYAASKTHYEKLPTVDIGGCKVVTHMSSESIHESSSSNSFNTATEDGDKASVRFLRLPRRPTPIPNKSSSSILTKGSKRSRFLERFSPPTKLVRKRVSFFKFLRPGNQGQQTRSISSPMLNATWIASSAQLDGDSEDPAELTISYELPERRKSNVTRSVSMGQLGMPPTDSPGGLLTPDITLERRPTLADYERNLSVVGDDRRRRSSVNIQREKEAEIEEHDRRESVSVRRKLSRARALRDDASPLMTQALEKHQQEKALFRSASKQRDSLKGIQPGPTFGPSSFVDTRSSVSAPVVRDYSDLLDPLEKGQLTGLRREQSAGQFLTPPVQAPGSSVRSSAATSITAPSTKTSLGTTTVRITPSAGKRIGSSLESWSRYPSHTRSERSGPAGANDRVGTRDFAAEINPNEIRIDEDTEAQSPVKRNFGDSSSPRSRSAAPSARSVAFDNIKRYYSNLFHTRDWHGQNRRTSVTLGGRLEHPELELLAPQVESANSHKNSERLKEFEEHCKAETEKLKHYLKEEEHKLEGFVKEEEQKLEEFWKREEGKLKNFVEEEEDKLVHSHSGHHRGSSSHSSQSSKRQDSPFRTEHIFDGPLHQTEKALGRSETAIGPNDGMNDTSMPRKIPDTRLGFDGSNEVKQKGASKAEVWSDLYKECLLRPISRGIVESDDATTKTQFGPIPPPKLKLVKPRTPEKAQTLDPKASIRRFPSVTVIDDQKGHSRSISLVSVQTRKSTTVERSSTHELVELIQAREQEERERLLDAIKLVRL